MNFLVPREGNHIEYKVMAFIQAFTIVIHINTNSMLNIWRHHHSDVYKDSALILVQSSSSFWRISLRITAEIETILLPYQMRKPLRFLLPLKYNVACYLSMGFIYHHLPPTWILENFTIHGLHWRL